ncbi:MAG: hypothetical protein PF483_01660 [Halothiobacillus sp.]|nr:hypothetical protein [Halothiobacillus sp.]
MMIYGRFAPMRGSVCDVLGPCLGDGNGLGFLLLGLVDASLLDRYVYGKCLFPDFARIAPGINNRLEFTRLFPCVLDYQNFWLANRYPNVFVLVSRLENIRLASSRCDSERQRLHDRIP